MLLRGAGDAVKLKINRSLNDGIYWVSFSNGELTEAETRLVKTFGAPGVELSFGDPGLYLQILQLRPVKLNRNRHRPPR